MGIFIKVKKNKLSKNEFSRVATEYIIEKVEKQFLLRFKNSSCNNHPNHTSIITLSGNISGDINIDKDFCCSEFQNSLDFSLD